MQMAKQMQVPIIGVVENMSYFTVPGSRKRIEIFGKSKAQEMAKSANAPLLGQIPIDPELAQFCDDGIIERYDSEELSTFAEAFLKAVANKSE
jgi:hypothetical protein